MNEVDNEVVSCLCMGRSFKGDSDSIAAYVDVMLRKETKYILKLKIGTTDDLCPCTD